MKKLTNIFFSMQTMGILLLVFAAVIGTATFIENDFGSTAAKAVVYSANWFNILLLLLAINLTGNIFIYKLYTLRKLPVFLFHFAFLVILLGSAITRFASFEGMMHIREGKTSASMMSDKTYIDLVISDGKDSVYNSEPVYMSVLTPKKYKTSVTFNNDKYRFKSVKFIPNAQEIIRDDENGVPYIILVASHGMGRQTNYFKYNEPAYIGPTLINFGDNPVDEALNIRLKEDSLFFSSNDTIFKRSMMGMTMDTILPGSWFPFELKSLYEAGDLSVVATLFYKNGILDYETYSGNDVKFNDAVVIDANLNGEMRKFVLRGGKGLKGNWETLTTDGVSVSMRYGAKILHLPFVIQLLDFQLERYPGSNSPSSYASEIQLIDKEKGVDMPYRIYMNHVLNYRGYRFFQSSYDQDELGTILSVNHDYWGTLFTYIGYFLMSLGMFLALFYKHTRFAKLGRSITKKSGTKAKVAAAIFTLLLLSPALMAQHTHKSSDDVKAVDKEQAEKFGKLLVQSHDGRIKPINTLSSELLRKIAQKTEFMGQTPDQVLLGMISNPYEWQMVPIIKVKHPELKKFLGIDGKYASYLDFIDMKTGTYKLGNFVSIAHSRKPSEQGTFDKDVIKADERMNICYMLYRGDFLNILPNPVDPYAKWFNQNSRFTGIPPEDSAMMTQIIPNYLKSVRNGEKELADDLVAGIDNFQKHYAAEIIPPESKVNMEIRYNKMNIFNNLSKFYLLIGLLLIVLAFIEIFRDSKALRIAIKVFIILVIIGFIYQTAGLAMRWYISGHAPWSDGYESMIYIAWVTLLAGLIFSKQSNMTIAATTFLTSIILMVAHLSWMDPEITPLVPVLKSYWLTIHVSIITASYGFLALSALLGFMNLILMALKTKKNYKTVDQKINNLSAINERALIIGLYTLTIGTFLGGVWANESWGRYWGWDPKETWALVSVLIYAFIAHMNAIPGLKDRFSFNFASLISYAAILMTYFGVNYYLSGLHSYASGDPVPVPTFVYYALGVVALISVWAYMNNKRFQKEEVQTEETA